MNSTPATLTTQQFQNKKVLVIGDIMLDTEITGTVSRISPEAPVPIIHAQQEKHSLGGAALVCHTIKNLGGEPIPLGVVGEDTAAASLRSLFTSLGIPVHLLFAEAGRQTTEKIRYFGNDQQMIRLDYESIHPISSVTETILLTQIQEILPLVHVIVLSDYGKGLLTASFVASLFALASQSQKPVVVDGKPQHVHLYKDASVVTFNHAEANLALGYSLSNEDRDTALLAAELTKRYNVASVITRGKKGMTICDKNGKIDHIQGRALEVADITGAGDAVTSILALSIAVGYDIFTAAKLANYGAGVVVTKKGSATLSKQDMQKFLRLDIYEYLRESIHVKQAVIENQMDQIEELAAMIIDAYKKGNKLLVFGNGGSAADAQHLAAEFVGRYKMERPGLPAIALTTDSSIITAVGNDYGYDFIFSRQVEAHCRPGDIVLGITTSGNSPNVMKAFEAAKRLGAKTAVWTGRDGGHAAKIADVAIIVPSNNTPRIQEVHVALIHIICELFEDHMHKQGYF